DELEEAVEHLGHEVPGRAGVEPEAAGAPAAGPSTDLRSSLEDLDAVAVPGEQRRRRESGDAAADDDGARPGRVRGVLAGGRGRTRPDRVRGGTRRCRGRAGHRRPPTTAAWSTIHALTASGTRTRRVRISTAGVARSRRESSANRAWASHTARLLLGGSSTSASRAAARSASMSSRSASRWASLKAAGSRPGK